jgi:formylglycine-generating enzyme required for sulfatase activity
MVDTDLPVPRLSSALRVDLYTEGAERWYASRTVALVDPRDWPASFSVFNPEDAPSRAAWVRLRVYPRGRERDYRGERFLAPPPADLPAEATYLPPPPIDEASIRKLIVDGSDRTPSTEPEPGLTIDRLIRVELKEGEIGRIPIVLRGDCVGTMADLAGGLSCIDTEKVLAPIETAALEPIGTTADTGPSLQGTFGPTGGCTRAARPATGAPWFDEEVCVPAGAFIFGNAEAFGLAAASGVPERIAALPAFFIDRHEVTVARYRRAFAEGLESLDGTPVANDGPFVDNASNNAVTFCTHTTFANDREEFAVNCLSYEAARRFCQFYGGDLPTEAQWEYVAQVAGRENETPYPWGTGDPDCDAVVFARVQSGVAAFLGANHCVDRGIGPTPVTAGPGDLSLGLGVIGLGGGMVEHMRDVFAPLDAVCWARAPLFSPECQFVGATGLSVRGGGWALTPSQVYPGQRAERQLPDTNLVSTSPALGFRCAWPDTL